MKPVKAEEAMESRKEERVEVLKLAMHILYYKVRTIVNSNKRNVSKAECRF